MMAGKQRFFPASLQKSTYLDSFSRLMTLFVILENPQNEILSFLKNVSSYIFQLIFLKEIH